MQKVRQLIFVYNANSGKVNMLMDMMHKIFRPSSYACNLCAVTYGVFTIKNEWETFIKDLPMETVFYHKDEFLQLHTWHQAKFPIVLVNNNNNLQEVISTSDLEAFTLKDLKAKVNVIVSENNK